MSNENKNLNGHQANEHDEEHDFDGIKELNNPAPRWLMLILFGSIGFSLIYFVHYLGYPQNQRDQVSEYELSVAAAERAKEALLAQTAEGAAMLSEKQVLEEGAKLYLEKGCIACHGSAGEGNSIGPNLTDASWINGCAQSDVEKVIREGVPAKGMTPYSSMMTDKQIANLSTYIRKVMVGSNPSNAKAAQGDECTIVFEEQPVVASSAKVAGDPGKGAAHYAQKGCVACHGTKGEGNNIGPNLADNAWIHGCSHEAVAKIIKEGKPEKGMTPYKSMMTDAQIDDLTAYILETLVGSTPDNAKAAQGDVCN